MMEYQRENGLLDATGSQDLAKLEESFKIFNETTRDLEQAYQKLTRRATRVDSELHAANSELVIKINELEKVTSDREQILNALPNGVVVIDEVGTITCINPAAERILGRPAAELVGRSREAMIGSTGQTILIGVADVERSKGRVERELVTLNGSRRRLSISISALEEGGELQVLTDLTVMTRLKQQVNRLDTLAALGEMAAGVAHEIRNPLNGINGFAGLMERALDQVDDDSSLRRYASNIRKGVSEVNDIITNLLTFASDADIQLKPVALAPMLDAVIAGMASLSEAKNATIEFLVDPECQELLVAGDSVKLKIVFNNIFKNALDVIPDSGAIVCRLSYSPNAGQALVTISDNGGGIDDNMKERIFRPFTTNKASGTGLGLAITHKFVSMHGGNIAFADIDGGTRFSVVLPLAVEGQNS